MGINGEGIKTTKTEKGDTVGNFKSDTLAQTERVAQLCKGNGRIAKSLQINFSISHAPCCKYNIFCPDSIVVSAGAEHKGIDCGKPLSSRKCMENNLFT